MECLIFSKTKKLPPLSRKKIEAALFFVLKKEQRPGLISLHLLGDAAMKKMNYNFRGKNKTTDVLSFSAAEEKNQTAWPNPEQGNYPDLGDLFLNPSQIARQAKEWGVGTKEEFVRMLIHGTLHILGYDHMEPAEAKIMFSKQEKYLDQILEK